jgi:DNA-binding SARP family transcriptional activator
MQFRLLGALEAGSGGTVVDLGPPKQRAVLAILLLHVGEIVSIDRIIDLLWGDEPPRTAAHSVQIYVSDLRKSLEAVAGKRLILTRPPGYQLDTPPETVDARHFEALVQRGSAQLNAGDRDAAIATLRTALELWRGPALSDFAYEEFAQPYVRRLHDMHLDAIETLAAAELDAGRTGQVVPLLEAAIRDDPLRERSRELLMVALYRSGRHAEALRNYDKLRELLRDELGLEPSPSLQRLRDRVLLHDPALVPIAEREPEAVATRNPYKGLQAFGESDAEDFFGRDALVERLVSRWSPASG